MAYHRSHGVDTRIVRIFNTYGPRMRINDGRVVPNFIRQALQGEPLTVYGEGNQTRSFCYVSDLVDGIYRLLLSDESDPCNIGNPAEMTILDFAQTINEITGNPGGIRFEPLPVDDPKQRQPDITKAKAILGWTPQVPLMAGDGADDCLVYGQAAINPGTLALITAHPSCQVPCLKFSYSLLPTITSRRHRWHRLKMPPPALKLSRR